MGFTGSTTRFQSRTSQSFPSRLRPSRKKFKSHRTRPIWLAQTLRRNISLETQSVFLDREMFFTISIEPTERTFLYPGKVFEYQAICFYLKVWANQIERVRWDSNFFLFGLNLIFARNGALRCSRLKAGSRDICKWHWHWHWLTLIDELSQKMLVCFCFCESSFTYIHGKAHEQNRVCFVYI